MSAMAAKTNGMASSARSHAISPAASPEEAAAIAAALETFMRATAPSTPPPTPNIDPWQRAAIAEGVEREPLADVQEPWINT